MMPSRLLSVPERSTGRRRRVLVSLALLAVGAVVCVLAAAAGLALLQELFVPAMALLLLMVFGVCLLLLVQVLRYQLEVLEQVQQQLAGVDEESEPAEQ